MKKRRDLRSFLHLNSDLEAHADARPIQEPAATAELYVSYTSSSPIDVTSLSDGDIAAFEAEIIAPDGTVVPLTEPLVASLSEYKAVGSNRRIEATCTLAPAGGGGPLGGMVTTSSRC